MRGARAPWLARVLVSRLTPWVTPRGRADDVLGDLEEGHRRRVRRRGRAVAAALTMLLGGGLRFNVSRYAPRQAR